MTLRLRSARSNDLAVVEFLRTGASTDELAEGFGLAEQQRAIDEHRQAARERPR
jgi:hypothetical protein